MVEDDVEKVVTPEVPDLSAVTPESSQRAATEDELNAARALQPIPGELLGKDLAADLSGLAYETPEIRFSKVAIAALNSVIYSTRDATSRAERDLATERDRTDKERERAATAELNAAVLATQLAAARESSSLRLVVNALGAVALGFVPFAADKAGSLAAIVVGVFGAALLVTAWLFRPRVKA